jgi:hypothetical protein
VTSDDPTILQAAHTIAAELDELLPDEADAARRELDPLMEHAHATDGEERTRAVDRIVRVLTTREATRRRYQELLVVEDVARGDPGDLYAADTQLAGEDSTAGSAVLIACATCGFVNKLTAYPARDDLPECQNNEPPAHTLALPD